MEIFNEIGAELEKADLKHGDMFSSLHEAYAVLKEEVDEYWHEVKHGTPERAREEIIQVAAMAIKTLRLLPQTAHYSGSTILCDYSESISLIRGGA